MHGRLSSRDRTPLESRLFIVIDAMPHLVVGPWPSLVCQSLRITRLGYFCMFTMLISLMLWIVRMDLSAHLRGRLNS